MKLGALAGLAWLAVLVQAQDYEQGDSPDTGDDSYWGPEGAYSAKLNHTYENGGVDPGIYSESESVFPFPFIRGSGGWEHAFAQAQDLVSQLTLTEKVNITTGTGWQTELCVGTTGGVPRLGVPGMCLQDSPLGVRDSDFNSVFPPGIQVASTWDKGLMYARGYAMGQEFKGKGANIGLGPVAGPLGRNPEGGRNWEGFSPDPVLAGVAMYETIQGMQDAGTMACAKHYIGNEQEHFRQVAESNGFGTHNPINETLSSNIDDRVMHEIYLWPFADAVRAGAGSFMCSYNRLNNSYACQNSKVLNGLLKDELDFQGFVMSDWGAAKSGVASAISGMDMLMPGDGAAFSDGLSFYGRNLTIAVLNGSVPETRLNDMATRILTPWFMLGQDQNFPDVSFSSWSRDEYNFQHFFAKEDFTRVNYEVDVRRNHASVIKNVAANSIVILKNEDSALPLGQANGSQKMALIGEDAGPSVIGPNGCADRGCDNGTLGIGWGSGTANYPYLVSPLDTIQLRAIQEGYTFDFVLENFDLSYVNTSARQADTSIVFINSDSGEGYINYDGNEGDRNNLTAWLNGDDLVMATANQCKNTIVVVHSTGPLIIESWADHPNVTAIVWAGLPGQESGTSLEPVLFGDLNPSGKLPYTIAHSRDDYSSHVMYEPNDPFPQDEFTEGLMVDYRAFDARNITPRYEFGFGLSYTTFDYSNLQVKQISDSDYAPAPTRSSPPVLPTSSSLNPADYLYPTSLSPVYKYIYPYINSTDMVHHGDYPYPDGYSEDGANVPYNPAGGAPGGNPSLYDVLFRVTFDIANTGSRDGQEVAQVYIGYPDDAGEPPKQLRAFDKVSIQSGDSTNLSLDLLRRDFSMWDSTIQNWRVPSGQFNIYVGKSSRNIVLTHSISM